MAEVVLLPAAGYAAMPWRNGAGVTREIAVDASPGSSGAPFRWRLSMADLAGDGPFSEIPGVDRVLVLLAGDDVALAIGGAPPAPLGRHEAIAFPGDVPTSLTMAPGAGRDLNLMWDRARAACAVAVLAAGERRRLAAPIAFAIAIGGPADVAVDGTVHGLGEQDALRVDGGADLAVATGDVCVAEIS